MGVDTDALPVTPSIPTAVAVQEGDAPGHVDDHDAGSLGSDTFQERVLEGHETGAEPEVRVRPAHRGDLRCRGLVRMGLDARGDDGQNSPFPARDLPDDLCLGQDRDHSSPFVRRRPVFSPARQAPGRACCCSEDEESGKHGQVPSGTGAWWCGQGHFGTPSKLICPWSAPQSASWQMAPQIPLVGCPSDAQILRTAPAET